jgi:CRP-like cAMP-binding protein
VNDAIYQCGDPTLYWHLMVAGAARECAISYDGRRQIVDFLLPGDLFGFGAHEVHRFSTEVIAPRTSIVRYPRRALEQLAESDRDVSRCIREVAFEAIVRLQARTLILGRSNALARVSAFLLEWADRGREGDGTTISLPMSRYDIADYLAVAVETVCRALTALRRRQVITYRSARHLTICDRQTLELLTEDGDEDTEGIY